MDTEGTNTSESDFDAEINALLNGPEEASAQATPQAKEQTVAEQVERRSYGGREWESWDAVGKAYDALQKDYSKKGQLLSEKERLLKDHDEAINWSKAIRGNKDLYDRVSEVIKQHNARPGGATSGIQAQQAAQISSEVAKRLEVLEQREANRALDAEVRSLKSKYNLGKEDVASVLEKATVFLEQGRDLPLEDVYRIVAFDKRTALARSEGESQGINKMRTKQSANVGSSSTSGVSPAAKGPVEMSGGEYDAAIEAELAKFGYSS